MKNLASIALAIAVLALSSTTVQADGDHNTPKFDDESTTMCFEEYSQVNTLVGQVSASDYEYPSLDRVCKTCPSNLWQRHEENVIRYTLEGSDSNLFSGELFAGTIMTKEWENYERGARYSVTVKAENGRGESDEINVTIRVIHEDEPCGTSQQRRSDESSDEQGNSGDSQQGRSDDSSGDAGGEETSEEPKSEESSDDAGGEETSEEPKSDDSSGNRKSTDGNAPRGTATSTAGGDSPDANESEDQQESPNTEETAASTVESEESSDDPGGGGTSEEQVSEESSEDSGGGEPSEEQVSEESSEDSGGGEPSEEQVSEESSEDSGGGEPSEEQVSEESSEDSGGGEPSEEQVSEESSEDSGAEEPPTPTVELDGISASHSSVSENDGPVTITVTVTLDKAAVVDETITLAIVSPTLGKTAKQGEDFDATLDGTITIAKGQRTGTAQLILTPADNATADGPKAFAVQATSSSGHQALINIRIDDDDEADGEADDEMADDEADGSGMDDEADGELADDDDGEADDGMDDGEDDEDDSGMAFAFTGAVADQAYTAGAAITALQLPEAMGGEGDVTYRVFDLPAGLTFDADTRTISGTPTAATDGAVEVTYLAQDSAGAGATLTFSITVNPELRLGLGDS